VQEVSTKENVALPLRHEIITESLCWHELGRLGHGTCVKEFWLILIGTFGTWDICERVLVDIDWDVWDMGHVQASFCWSELGRLGHVRPWCGCAKEQWCFIAL